MIKDWRLRRRLSQRELARRAGLAYKTVQLIESGRDCRWSTLAKLAKVMDMPNPQALATSKNGRTAAETAALLGTRDDDAWKTVFFDFVDDFRRASREDKIAQAPAAAAPRALALIASAVECLCAERGLPTPWWCAAAPALDEPWFVSGMESLKASALIESPAQFRQRNVFVLGNFLARA